MRATDARLSDLTDYLRAEGRPRVWSIIVTILGDVAEPMGGAIDMQALLAVCRTLGIEEQAVRTAMSRLQKEGLVASARSGRRASYQFSALARESYREAAKVIYAAPHKPERWAAALLPPPPERARVLGELKGTHPFVLADAMVFWPKDSGFAEEARLRIGARAFWTETRATNAPDWAARDHAPKINAEMCDVVRTVAEGIADTRPSDPHETLAIRILMIHFWRRLVLRHPPIHAPLPNDLWPMTETQAALAKAYPLLVEASAPASGGAGTALERFRQI